MSSVGTLDLVHRNLAIVVGFAVLYVAYLVFRKTEPDRWLGRAAQVSLLLVAVQACAGLGLARWSIPPALQVVHLLVGSLLLGALAVLCLLAYRLDPRPDELPQEQAFHIAGGTQRPKAA